MVIDYKNLEVDNFIHSNKTTLQHVFNINNLQQQVVWYCVLLSILLRSHAFNHSFLICHCLTTTTTTITQYFLFRSILVVMTMIFYFGNNDDFFLRHFTSKSLVTFSYNFFLEIHLMSTYIKIFIYFFINNICLFIVFLGKNSNLFSYKI